MDQLGSVGSRVEGNTKSSPLINFKARKWCMTLNNYTENEFGSLDQYFKKHSKFYIIGKEGDEKTPHLQIYVEFKSQRYFNSLKKLNPRIHIEKANGSRDDNINYCSKEGNFTKTLSLKEQLKQEALEREYKDIIWKPWQQEILNILEQVPHNRKIKWYWEPTGNIGKSFLVKYIGLTRDIILVDGKKTDLFNQVLQNIDNNKRPDIILVDIPRRSKDFINYPAIEQLKNGCIYSGKYEGGQCYFPIPHVICFANSEPEKDSMSLDRWDIFKIESENNLDIDDILRDNL